MVIYLNWWFKECSLWSFIYIGGLRSVHYGYEFGSLQLLCALKKTAVHFHLKSTFPVYIIYRYHGCAIKHFNIIKSTGTGSQTFLYTIGVEHSTSDHQVQGSKPDVFKYGALNPSLIFIVIQDIHKDDYIAEMNHIVRERESIPKTVSVQSFSHCPSPSLSLIRPWL